MPSETWRIDAGDRVREVMVRCVARERWRCPDGHHEMTPMAAARAWAYRNCVMGAVLAPGEPTRAELAAQLATATASVQQLRADVELATAQRDAETCRADNAEAQLAAVTAERDALRAERDGEHDLIARQAAILTAVANALKGTPPALSSHSHHDLGAVAAATVAQQAPLVACVDALRAAATAAGWRDADASGEALVAWVRRGAMATAAGIAGDHGREGVASAIRLAAIDLTGGE